MAVYREISNTAIPYRTYTDITSDKVNFVLGSQNVMTTAQQLMERIPGFADPIETGAVTTFTSIKRHIWFPKWGGTQFYSIVNDITNTTSDVYKLLVGTDANYIKIFSSASTSPFDFAISNNTLYMGNGTDMRKYSSGTSTTKWGIAAPAGAPTIGTTGTGISAFSGWYYVYTYCNSSTGHESSASPLSACTGIVSNKTITVAVTASADGQVDQIRVYRTTDGGSTDPTLMREITGSPFTNTTQTVNDTTADTSLSTRTAPGFTTNDTPTASSKLCTDATGGRIFTAANATTYFSAQEELPANGVPQECFPSGLSGNNFTWPGEVQAQATQADGVAIFTRGKIWKIAGNLRNNFIPLGLLDRRGAVNVTAVASLGNSVAWLDTASQVFLDGTEVGFDIRNDIKSIDHSQAYLSIHIQGRFHWLCLLDGANNKMFIYDMDTEQWMPPKALAFGSAASALSSGESASGTVKLAIALNKTQMYTLNAAKYNDGGTTYAATGILNLLKTEKAIGSFERFAIETDTHTASTVGYLLDDDPTLGTFTDITANISDPVRRTQGTNLVKKLYRPDGKPNCERVSGKFVWSAAEANFTCYTLEINPPEDQVAV